MIRNIAKILIVTLSAIALTACAQMFLDDEDKALEGEYKLVMSGIVSEAGSSKPISGIKITFSAFKENSVSVLPLMTKTVYTDGKGIYNLEAEGFSEAIKCIITAEATRQNDADYEKLSQDIVVTWSGDSFDEENSTFFVNNCNFQMIKAR